MEEQLVPSFHHCSLIDNELPGQIIRLPSNHQMKTALPLYIALQLVYLQEQENQSYPVER